MWLMNYITKNSVGAAPASRGSVSNNNTGLSVNSSMQYKQLKSCMPYGVVSVPPVGECAVVLPLEDGGGISLGVVSKGADLAEGEVMLRSKGGASIVLKNNGKVLINGEEYT